MSDHIRISEKSGVLTLTFARLDKKNAITDAMYGTLARELKRAASDRAVRVVLFEGEGDMFTAGNDLGDFAAVASGQKSAESLAAYPFIVALAEFPKPVVAAVQGNAVGIGFTMLLHCDAVVIAEDAKLTAPFANLALVPEAGSSLLLPARIGHARAYAIFALGEAIDGKTAATLGLANAALPAVQVNARAREIAEALAAKPMGALIEIKALMRDVKTIRDAIDKETKLFGARLKTPEAKEAFAAFKEKRKPDFGKLS